MDVVVFGASSLGSIVGGLLAHEHDVTLAGRESHIETVRTAGLWVTGAIEARVETTVATDMPRRL